MKQRTYPLIELDPRHCGYFHNGQQGPIAVRRAIRKQKGNYGHILYLGKTINVKRMGNLAPDLPADLQVWGTYSTE